ncbi:MAG: iron ABC transporter permease [Candidatus Hydrothermae bacterium]|nr:iron ABC transporter permease [Candidatus Hydrothermae bacterium]MDD3649539.1 iron ABC transporter permease [Candidatus Hydrothermia bacterium]HOK23412.1 iron ABC transporter permease [Candidatus Hydrothermia bacterium]HOL23992.1 iron ABC transporter permease [Candidatus Hydrothermia bacterium]HPO79161.1 iron ABC transporter permease [Candidatus Hydrothermia bacterium]
MRKNWFLWLITIILTLVIFSILYLTNFTFRFPPKEIFYIRLIRFLVTSVAGFTLAIAGSTLQTILQNPLADPYILGISSGALLGVALSKIFGSQIHLTAFLPAFVFAMVTIFSIYYLARVKGTLVKELLILGGLFLNFFFNGIVFYLLVLKREVLEEILYILWGYTGIIVTTGELPFLIISLFIAFILACLPLLKVRELDAITLGDYEAMSLGVDVHKVRNFVFFTTSASTALVVSITGAIGFVGLMVPNIIKKIIGGKHAILIPASGLCGALLMLIADAISRNISPVELPLSIILGIFAVPFFFWIIWRQRNESNRG